MVKTEVVRTIEDMKLLSKEAREKGKIIGFVPTMGYFHEGHLSLMRRARSECGFVVVSIFVNPIQFCPGEDYYEYPRDEERDKALAGREGVDVVFIPSVEEMYPPGYATYVEVEGWSNILCGQFRPGHFRGVTTVVLKLFNIVAPHKAYFGEKDYQQFRIIEKMTRDLNLDIEIVPCPIVREEDGLAMSSRNVYLSPEERKSATVLYRSLSLAQELVRKGEKNSAVIKAEVERTIKAEPLVKSIDYIAIVDPYTLQDVEEVEKEARLLLAVRIGKTRLLDNASLQV